MAEKIQADHEKDFLDELIEERTARNSEFPKLMEAAARRRELLRALAEQRERKGQTQTETAARMHTSQSSLARLEAAGDTKLSTLERFAEALGLRVQYHLVASEDPRSADDPAVIVHVR